MGKCGGGQFCKEMEKRLENPERREYGLFAMRTITLDPVFNRMERRTTGVLYQEDVETEGVAFNFCPFCGKRIDWFREVRQ
jgi:hypothetical protein